MFSEISLKYSSHGKLMIHVNKKHNIGTSNQFFDHFIFSMKNVDNKLRNV